MSELKITQNSLENAILKDGQFVSGYVANSGYISASGNGAHAEGYADNGAIDASGNGTYAEGFAANSAYILADGQGAHAEGYAVAVGKYTLAKGDGAHAEGISTQALSNGAHAEGCLTVAEGNYSHVSGLGTVANQEAMTAIGKYNITGKPGDLFVVGSGNANDRRNAMRINEGTDGDDRSIYWYFNDNAYLKLKYNPDDGNSSLSLNHESGMVMIDNEGDLYMHGQNASSHMRIVEESVIIRSPEIQLSSDNSGNTTVSVTGEVRATGGFYDESDIRKKDILSNISLEKSYELLDKCQEIIYKLKEDPNKKEQVGMIAQEVEEFFPEIVSTDNNGFKSLDYARLSVICLRLIKDIVEQIKELKNEIKNLKN